MSRIDTIKIPRPVGFKEAKERLMVFVETANLEKHMSHFVEYLERLKESSFREEHKPHRHMWE